MTFLDVANELGRLRKAWAMHFLWLRMTAKTDAQAKAGADELYIEDITRAEARYEIAKSLLSSYPLGELLKEVRNDDQGQEPTADTDDEPAETTTEEDREGQDCAD
jgi:hypothetical protein